MSMETVIRILDILESRGMTEANGLAYLERSECCDEAVYTVFARETRFSEFIAIMNEAEAYRIHA